MELQGLVVLALAVCRFGNPKPGRQSQGAVGVRGQQLFERSGDFAPLALGDGDPRLQKEPMGNQVGRRAGCDDFRRQRLGGREVAPGSLALGQAVCGVRPQSALGILFAHATP